ncbi:MAG: SagB family peptide dehydrogenase [Pseudomonadota bacterium]
MNNSTSCRVTWRLGTLGNGGELINTMPAQIRALFHTGIDEGMDEIDDQVVRAHCVGWLKVLKENGLLVADVWDGPTKIMTLLPTVADFDVPPLPSEEGSAETGHALVLSRFAYARPANDGVLFCHPDAPCDVLVVDRDFLWQLLSPHMPQEDEAPGAHGRPAMGILLRLGIVLPAGAAEDTASATWEFHDRIHQAAWRPANEFSRNGRTHRFGRGAQPNFHRTGHAPVEHVELPAPDQAKSRDFSDVLASRRSIREHSEKFVSLPTLSHLLHSACRTQTHESRSEREMVFRPYPSGGAVHELNFTLFARRCEGLKQGVYHYDCATHSVARLPGGEVMVGPAFKTAAETSNEAIVNAAGLIIVSSEMPKLAWYYEGIAEKVTLINAGCALQTLHLAATNLDLAGWIIGHSFAREFEAATGRFSIEAIPIAAFAFGHPAD